MKEAAFSTGRISSHLPAMASALHSTIITGTPCSVVDRVYIGYVQNREMFKHKSGLCAPQRMKDFTSGDLELLVDTDRTAPADLACRCSASTYMQWCSHAWMG